MESFIDIMFSNMNGFEVVYTILASTFLAGYLMLLPYRMYTHVRGHLNRRARFRSAEHTLMALINHLPSLRDGLDRVARMNDEPLARLIEFFNVVSPWHDREIGGIIAELKETGNGQYDQVLESLTSLNHHIHACGRREYGWNRTKPGELVTLNTVWLGDIYGLWTKQASFWLSRKDEPKGGWSHYDPNQYFKVRNSYDVIADHVSRFMQDHADSMIEIMTAVSQTSLKRAA